MKSAIHFHPSTEKCAEKCAKKGSDPFFKQVPARLLAAIAIAFIAAFCLFERASIAQESTQASTSRQSREEVLRAIPLQQLNQATQQKLAPILRKPSLYRKMPVETIRCDHDMHVFLIRKPEVIVSIWQLMGITQVSAKRTGEYHLRASDGVGTDSNVELVYGTPGLHIYYGEGKYEGTMIRNRVDGKCVIVLQSEMTHDGAGTPLVTNRMDVFLQFDQVGAKFLAKTLHPLVGRAADHNFIETARFLSRISDAATTNSGGVQQMAARLPSCDQKTRDEFAAIAVAASTRAAAQQSRLQASQQQLTPGVISPATTSR